MTDISKERAASVFRLLEIFYPDELISKFLPNLIYLHRIYGTASQHTII